MKSVDLAVTFKSASVAPNVSNYDVLLQRLGIVSRHIYWEYECGGVPMSL